LGPFRNCSGVRHCHLHQSLAISVVSVERYASHDQSISQINIFTGIFECTNGASAGSDFQDYIPTDQLGTNCRFIFFYSYSLPWNMVVSSGWKTETDRILRLCICCIQISVIYQRMIYLFEFT